MDAAGNATVSWKVTVPENVQAVTYKIVGASDSFSDGEEAIIPVLSNRLFIQEALPLAVGPKDSVSVTFQNLKANDSQTRVDHKLKLEFTANSIHNQ